MAQVRVYAAKPAKAVCGNARAAQVGKFYAARVADDNGFDVTFAVNQDTDLAARFMRKFRHLARKFRRHDLLGSDAAGVKFFDAAKLVWLQTGSVALNVANVS